MEMNIFARTFFGAMTYYTTRILLVLFLLVFAHQVLAQQNDSINQLHRTHYYDGKPIREFSDVTLKVTVKNMNYSSNAPAVFGGKPYIGTTKDLVLVIGEMSIEGGYQLKGSIESAPFVNDRFMITGTTTNTVFACDRLSGKILWKYKTKGTVNTSPLLINRLVYVGCADGKLYALDTLGKLQWTYDLKSPVASPSFDDSIIYIGSIGGTSAALNAISGKEIWKSSLAGRIPVVGAKLLYCINRNGTVIALDKKTGEERWRYDEFASSRAFELALSPKALVYACDASVGVIDPITGKKLWATGFQRPICGSPMIVGDVLYVPCSDWNLYAYDLSSSVAITKVDIGFAPYGTPAFGDGKIFYPSKQVLYTFEPKE